MREFIAVSAHDDFAEMVVQVRSWKELGKVCFFPQNFNSYGVHNSSTWTLAHGVGGVDHKRLYCNAINGHYLGVSRQGPEREWQPIFLSKRNCHCFRMYSGVAGVYPDFGDVKLLLPIKNICMKTVFDIQG